MKDVEQFKAEHFPVIEPGIRPFGPDVLVQLRTLKEKSAGGIVLPNDTREFNNENTMVAKVIALGPLAYKNRETAAAWPEGVWAAPGDLVLCPKWGGFRFHRTLPSGESARFCLFKDHELRGGLTPAFEGFEEIL